MINRFQLCLQLEFAPLQLGDATSNVFLMLLEVIAARKGVADLPRLVKWDPGAFEDAGAAGGRGGNASSSSSRHKGGEAATGGRGAEAGAYTRPPFSSTQALSVG